MNLDNLFLATLIQALKNYASDSVNNGSVLGGTSTLTISTPKRLVPALNGNPNEGMGYVSAFIIVDKLNRCAFPYIAFGTPEEVNTQIENVRSSISGGGSNGILGIQSTGATSKVIPSNTLQATMDTVLTETMVNRYSTLFGENVIPEAKLASIIQQTILDINNFIRNYGLNAATILTSYIQDTASDIVLMNGQFVMPNGLQPVITNAHTNAQGMLSFGIYFNLSYNLQRCGKSDMLYSL